MVVKVARVFTCTLLFSVLLYGTAWTACGVSSTGVDFGNYDVLNPAPTDSVGRIIVLCFPRANVTISIGPSPNSGGFNPRSMKHVSASYLLDYNLYRDRNRTEIWGDGTGGTFVVTERVNFFRIFRVYGRIPPGQDVLVGDYSETLVVTVTW